MLKSYNSLLYSIFVLIFNKAYESSASLSPWGKPMTCALIIYTPWLRRNGILQG